MVDCSNWMVTAQWHIPINSLSGGLHRCTFLSQYRSTFQHEKKQDISQDLYSIRRAAVVDFSW
jgi:hypothetical protein